MNETMNEGIIALVSLLNQTNGIPLTITQTTTTNPYQFYLTLAMSGFFIFYFIIKLFGASIMSLVSKTMLRIFVRKNEIKNMMVIKHTSQDLFSASMIDRNTLESIQKALIKYNGKPFDLVLYTPGGEVFSATYISRMFQKYPGKIRSIVPTFAMSGGTLLALSTDEIYMNDYSCLGAVDPQLGNLFKFGSAKGWKEIVRIKGKKAEDNTISMKLMGEQYTKSIRENIKGLLKNKVDKKDMNNLLNYLTQGNIEHGFNITKDILIEMGLDIKDIPMKTNNRLLKLIKYLPEGVTNI